jgi:hypothetical protein
VDLSDWVHIAPTMDVWLEVESNELHYVANIIPTLNWSGGKLIPTEQFTNPHKH